ncbi:phosphoribosylpyrophosphate synthetase [Mucilaginibacter sp. BJC16-A38]|uniref:phosphoribosylpyrophosphate synthetase n=1 Tax=Mucilaginibacter phenanthrenivorans TaxID=1234842 RepID=UPI002156FA0A|nr:phosphoribosylpyrophosphate synthetase [Mucilaginibacter phenanthrenivorans]MCR8556113.1 phosphoribosylpyrophosphate synthetase [Mucilaginibacter phenanthrenivorans]
MKTYNNLVEATNDLMKRGYTENLSLEGDTVDDKDKNIHMTADDIEIDEFYRFEGASNPDDNAIVYAVTSKKYDLKGVLINAFGTYANTSSSAILAKLNHDQVSDNLNRADKPEADAETGTIAN